MTQIMETIPEQMRDHPMARMLHTFARESTKDLRRIPPEFIEQLSLNISEAFMWVAKGKMSDLDAPSLPDMPNETSSPEVQDVSEIS